MVYFEKSQPAPDTLASRKSYRESDVIERLCSDFKNKCYLCEIKVPTSIVVEHFRPHRGDQALEFDWNNLFFACVHCNNVKAMLEEKRSFQDSGILNCTHKEDRVDERISYRLSADHLKTRVVLKNECAPNENDNVKVDNTIKLLDAIYNSTDTGIKTKETENLRRALFREIDEFLDLISAYKFSTAVDKSKCINRLKAELQNDSAFTAFKLWLIKDDPELSQLLLQ